MWIVALVACREPGEGTVPTTPVLPPGGCPVREWPEVREPESPEVRLVRILHVEPEAPAEVELELDGTVVATFPAAAVHDLPLLGLRAGEPHTATITLRCEGGGEEVVGPIDVDPGLPPEGWPEIEILVDDPARRAPGATFVDLWTDVGGGVAAFDADGVPVWALGTEERPQDAELERDGTIWIVSERMIRRVDLLGNELVRYVTAAEAREGDVPVDVVAFHHDVTPVPGGFLALGFDVLEVDEYPVAEADPYTFAPAPILDTEVLEVADDGTLLHRFRLSERLDTRRIGWNGREVTSGGFDWSHGNSVELDPADGDLIVSVRHQDAVLKMDRETGEVRWILSVPDGWRAPWDALRLQPEPGLTWPFHPHAPRITADGTLLMFDNGNGDRTTPYAGVDDGSGYWSRLVEYRVDEAAGTVAETWSADLTSTGPLFSGAYGDADRLPNGNTLGVWGWMFTESEDGPRNFELGRGTNSVRLVEVDGDGEIVWEASLYSFWRDHPGGWQTHRAQRLESWYPLRVR